MYSGTISKTVFRGRGTSFLHRRAGWLTGTAMRYSFVAGLGVALAPVTGAQAQSLPVNGTVTHGAATIDTAPGTVTVNQSTARAVIDWNSFSVGQGNTINFQQPNADSATLNRVTGNATTTIAGNVIANGSIYLVNPNGIAITSTGAVRTGGGFVASTLDMTDADFMAGKLHFAGRGKSSAVVNAGSIRAGDGAFTALLGGTVANAGSIIVPTGRLALGSGEQVALDLNGGNFLQVAVPTAALGGGALIENSGSLTAAGGLVEIKAAVLRDSIRHVVNMSGTISADSATGSGGRIILLGGADQNSLAGTVTITGSLSARATGATGNGGFVETSGARIDLNSARVSTLAQNGKAGIWLIDPVDFTISARGGDITGAALSANLANGNVSILSKQGAAGTNGDININDVVSWSANTLTLDAYRDINVNAVMNAAGTAGFVGIVGDVTQTGVGTSAGNLDFGMDIRGFYGKLNLASTSSFRLNGQDYVVITSLGAQGSTSRADLQGINVATSGTVQGFYVLGADIDASATAGWNGGAGFTPIGYTAGGLVDFRGQFNGLGHTISNLTINRTGSGPTGLFASPTTPATSGAQTVMIANVGLIGGRVTGAGTFTGSLVGDGTRLALRNVFSGADVTGGGSAVGGLVGGMSGSIVNAFATGDVRGDGIGAGGLVGGFRGSIDGAFATGDVTGCNRVTACFAYGGLIGQLDGNATLTNVFATGDIAGWRMLGGLVGQVLVGSTEQAVISDAYATGSVYANDPSFASAGGLIGQGQRLTLNRVFASGTITALAGTWAGGLVGENNGDTVTINNGYWDSEKTGYTFSCGRILCSGASGLTTNQSLLAASFAGWNMNGAGSAWRNYEGRTAPLLTALMTPAFIQMTAPRVTTIYNGADQTAAAGVVVRIASNGNAVDASRIYGTTTNSCSAGAGNCGNAGTYTITGTSDLFSDQFGYNLIIQSPLTSTLVINPAALNLTYTANTARSIYGNAIAAIGGSVSASGLVGSDTLAGVLAGTSSWTTGATSTSGAGQYAITGSGLTSINGNYTINAIQAGSNATAYTIDPRAITVTADALSRTYGAANPALAFAVGGLGLVNGDILSGSLATGATSASDIGNYAITQGTLANSNYAISFTGADLTVTPAALTITGNSGSRVYSGIAQTNGFVASGLVNGDTVTGVTGLASGRDVGSYTDNLTALTGTGLGNYIVTFVNGALSITPAALTITGDAGRKIYNGLAQTNGFTVSGLLGSDTVSSVAGLATGTNVGGYTDNLSSATGTGLSNYTIAYVNNGLTITPAALTVTYRANAATGIYGNVPGALGGSFDATGLVGSDALGDIILGTANWTTAARSTSGVGSYSITGSGLTSGSGNYDVTFLQAAGNARAFSVTPRSITVAANALSRLYGAANPTFTYSVGGLGLVNGDSLAGALATGATDMSNIGTYAITQGNLGNPNYAISYTGANLTVTPAPLTISGNNRSVNFTGLAQTNTFTVSGLRNADSVTGVSGLARGIDPGVYADLLSAAIGVGLGNYAITYVNGALTINALPPASGLVQFLEFTDASGNGPIAASGDVAADPIGNAACFADNLAVELREDGEVQLGRTGRPCV